MMILTPSFSAPPFYIMTLANFLMEAMDIYGLMFQIRSLRMVSLVLRNTYYVIPFVSAFKWMRGIYLKYLPLLRQTPAAQWLGLLCVDEYAGFFSLSLTLSGVLFQALQPLYGNAAGVLFVEDYTPSYIIAYTVLMIFSSFIGIIIPNRILNYKAYILRLEVENKRELVKHASHEIRTPLNTISMGVSLLEKAIRESTNDANMLSLVKDIEESNALAVGILTDLLNYEKIASKQMTLDLSKIHPIPFLTKVIRPFYLNARAKNMQINCNYDEVQLQNVLIDVDEGKMGQVVRNLVSNAVKFSTEGGVVEVNIRLRDHQWLRVEVVDCGPGVSLENQQKLFHEVAQFDPNANQGGGGSGVGLWISKKIVDMHGASISIRSELGIGSTFTLDIKIVQPPSTSFRSGMRIHPDPDESRQSGFEALLPLPGKHRTHAAMEAQHPLASADNQTHLTVEDPRLPPALPINLAESVMMIPEIGKTCTILIVDDSKVNRVMLTRLLTSMGHICYDACDGAVAVDMYQDYLRKGCTIDVVLLDSHMPNMNGSEAAHKLRELGYEGVVIGVTGDVMNDVNDPFLKSGVDGVMTKPIDMKKLEQLIFLFINRREGVKRNSTKAIAEL